MIYKCVEDADLMAEAKALAARLANGPTIALGTMRKVLRDGLSQDFSTTLDAEDKGQFIAGGTADAMEGIMAFQQNSKTERSEERRGGEGGVGTGRCRGVTYP